MIIELGGVPHVDWAALSPVVFPVLGIVAVLLLDVVGPQRIAFRRGHDVIALLALGASAVAVLVRVHAGTVISTLCVHDATGPTCSYVSSTFTLTLQGLVVGGAVVCLLLAADGDGADDRAPHHVLLLTVVTGALVLAGARDLVTLVVALETASLPTVALVALRRDAPAAQGALTLLLTAVGSLGMLLLGSALLLFATGSLHLDRISAVLSEPGLPHSVKAVALAGALLAAAGVGFKLSAVPFHLWTPDTYAGAPLPIAAFLAVVSKTAGATALVVLLSLGLAPLRTDWAPVLGVVAALTITFGNLVAMRQRVAVRVLAWSTVAQAGWVLLPLASASRSGGTLGSAGTVLPGGSAIDAVRPAVAASIGYLVAYVVASLAAFSVVVVLGRRHPAAEEHSLDAYRGLARRQPVAAAVLAFALACLAGLPPGVIGLMAKVVAVRPVVNASVWWLAVIAAINVALGIFYYLRWAALLFLPAAAPVPADASASVAAPSSANPAVPAGSPAPAVGGPVVAWALRPFEAVAMGVSALACVVLSVWPQTVAGILPHLIR